MDNTREKLIELLYEAEEQADKRCDFAENCDKCPANEQNINCMDWLKADCLLSLGVTVQKWIPVTERLPEPWKWILCYCEVGFIEMLRYDDFIEEWGSVNLNRAYKKDYVTHWMPLPEPPKGD